MNRLIAILVASVAILLMLGVVTLYSSTTHHPSLQLVQQHLASLGLGLVIAGFASFCDYSRLRKACAPKWFLAVSIILLVLVFLPGLGVIKNGAHRWLPLGQPSEVAKLALIIFLADYAATHQARMAERNAGFLYPGLIAAAVICLVFVEPDWGTATLIATVILALLLLAGVHWFYLVSATVIGLELFTLLLLQNPRRLERVLAFLDPETYQEGAGWQGWHSLLALGSGGWFGTFFGEGSHKNDFVPEQPTDFVLSLIGEELGFVGTLLVLVLFVILFVCGMRIAWRITDPFGQLLASGLTLLIGVQALINIGVVTSSLPNKGLPLPFVSYGGSNLVCMLTAVGLLVSLARHGPVRERAPAEKPFAARARPEVGGPVGSLLRNSLQAKPRGLRRRFVFWLQSRCNARFPSVALRSYQRFPDCAGKDAFHGGSDQL